MSTQRIHRAPECSAETGCPLRRVEQIQTRPVQGALLVRSVGAAQPLSVGSQRPTSPAAASLPLSVRINRPKSARGPKVQSSSADQAIRPRSMHSAVLTKQARNWS